MSRLVAAMVVDRLASRRGRALAAGAVIGLAAAFWLLAERPVRGPGPPSSSPSPALPAVGSEAVLEGARQPVGSEPDASGTPTPRRPADTPRMGAVRVRAVDDLDQRPLAGFSWSLGGDTCGAPPTGKAEGYVTTVAVPIGRAVSVSIQASGYQRSLAVDASLTPGSPPREIVARLVPIQPEAVVTLVVRAAADAPMTSIRVSCSRRLDPEGGDRESSRNAWQDLWTRESLAGDGDHRIAGLAAGRYRFRVQALEPGGRPRLLLPQTRAVVFDAVSHVTARVDLLEPGAGLILALRDSRGASVLGPSMSARVKGPTGGSDTGHWLALDGERTADPPAIVLPRAKACELWEALPAGRYVVEVVGAGIDTRREVELFAGQRASVLLP